MITAMEWYEFALLILGTFMVSGVFGWIVTCLVRMGRERGEND